MAPLIKRSVSLTGHRTSIALEAEFWDALAEFAARQGRSLAVVIAEVDATRAPGEGLASNLRLLALRASRDRH